MCRQRSWNCNIQRQRQHGYLTLFHQKIHLLLTTSPLSPPTWPAVDVLNMFSYNHSCYLGTAIVNYSYQSNYGFSQCIKLRLFDLNLHLELFDWAWCKNPPQQEGPGLPILLRSIVLTVQPLSVRHLTWEVRKCSECHHSPPTTRQQFPHCFCFVAAADHHLGVNNQLSLDIYFQ